MKKSAQIQLFSKIKIADKLLFTKHLSVMTKSGIPLTESLELLVEQASSQKFQKIINEVLESVRNGSALADALKKHPKVFDNFYTSMIATGEESGTLEENLKFLAEQIGKEYALRKKIQGAMLYPGLVLAAVIIMGSFISFFILPQLVDFFEAFDTELPVTTKILLFVANTSKNYGIYILVGFIALIFGFINLLRIPSVQYKWHQFLLKLPLFGKFIVYLPSCPFHSKSGNSY